MLVVTCPLDKRLHAHAKGHWRAKATATKDSRQVALALTLGALKSMPKIEGRAVVDYLFLLPDRKRRDLANLQQTAKPIIDGVVDAGGIEGDHWEALAIGKVDCVVVPGRFEVQLTFRSVSEVFQPTSEPPGTQQKLDVLAERERLGLPLWHEQDRTDLVGMRSAKTPFRGNYDRPRESIKVCTTLKKMLDE